MACAASAGAAPGRLRGEEDNSRMPGHERVQPELATRLPTKRPAERGRGSLPPELTSFLGRDAELADLKEALKHHRMVTITGPGGMGKTRISLHLAHQVRDDYRDGAWMIELAPLTDPALVIQETAIRLGVREVPGTSLLDTLAAHTAEWEALLVLDNCEHLVEPCAAMATRLLADCAELKILATSREPTGTHGEHVWRLAPLSLAPDTDIDAREGATLSDAARLFVERAWPDRAPAALGAHELSAVGQICSRLDGIPLAIELAAARARVMSVDDLRARLGDRLKLLTGGPRSVPRHQTMRATVDWSYQLLDAKERLLFQRVAVFAGGFAIGAVEDVCAGGGLEADEVLDVLSRLVDKSLVMPVELGDREAPLRMLSTLQEYSYARLLESGEAEAYARRHSEHYLRLAEQARDQQNSPAYPQWLDRLEREHDNLRAALGWSQGFSAELNLRLATSLIGFWDARGYLTESREWLARALAAWPEPTALRADALAAAGWLAQRQGDFAGAAALLEESAIIATAVDDRPVKARAQRNLALVRLLQGQTDDVERLVESALSISVDPGDRPGMAGALLVKALLVYFQGLPEEARRHGEHSLELHREVGDEKVAAFILACLATLALDEGDLARARGCLRESLEISQRLRERVDVALVLESCARLAAATSQPEHAIRLAGEASSVREAAGATSAPVWSAMVQATVGPARDVLGAAAADAAWTEGRSRNLEQAVDEAIAWLDAGGTPAERTGTVAPAPIDSGGLSRRELEVAALVGEGLRNREIAQKLFLSTRTVDAHVEHIRTKLDFHSRSQIAAWAVARGLVKN